MKMGHTFGAEHGFTGSANPTKEFRPTVPGFKRGGNIPTSATAEDAEPVENAKHGGLSHIKGHHKNYAHGGKVEHGDHPKHDHVKHDKNGYQMHKGHKGTHKE